MNDPISIVEDSFDLAWANAIEKLSKNSWVIWNLVVTIKNPLSANESAINDMTEFARTKGLVLPEQVLTTIFPLRIYKRVRKGEKEKFYRGYNLFYSLTRNMPHSNWGTYFKRMISYEIKDGKEYDQIGSIIEHIKNRKRVHGAANIIVIPQVGKESNRTMGAPCLNYITVQVETSEETKKISLLAVYRNHDFKERAFGNYWGLCQLLKYICDETDSEIGSVTCVSSHAYVNNDKIELKSIADKIIRK